MNALLLVAHGSRREQSNNEVTALASKLKNSCSDHYSIVRSAFLELADPLIPEGIKQCIEDGATVVVVLPYFLNSGRHVTKDIPSIVSKSQQAYPNITMTIASHLGQSDQMVNLLTESAKREIKG